MPDVYYAFELQPGGRRVMLKPGGRRFFGPRTLAWLRKRTAKRAAKQHVKLTLIVGKVESKRHKMYALMVWALHNERAIHYRQYRPMQSLNRWRARKLPISSDCSETAHGLAKAVGAPDPSRAGFNGYGNTGSMRAHEPMLPSVASCGVGDDIVYGPGSYGSHTAKVFKAGPNPVTFSHGQENGPRLYQHSVEKSYHGNVASYHDAGLG